MKDPARISQVLDQLQRTWEAQPDLPLATLFGMLETRGVGWGTDDETLVRALRDLQREHPGQLAGHSRTDAPEGAKFIAARYLVETESPGHRVTIDPFRVSVRGNGGQGHRPRPGVWGYQRIRTCRAGLPLVITDAAGIDHRLGVVARITMLDAHPVAEEADLGGLVRQEIKNHVYHLDFEGGDVAVLDHGLEVYTVGRREVSQRRLRWERLLVARPGEELTVVQSGGAVVELGVLAKIVALES